MKSSKHKDKDDKIAFIIAILAIIPWIVVICLSISKL